MNSGHTAWAAGHFFFNEPAGARPARTGPGVTVRTGIHRLIDHDRGAGAGAGPADVDDLAARVRRLAEVPCRLRDLGDAVPGVILNGGTRGGEFRRRGR
ncbi:hypothetical protein ACFY12_11580 [Streptomyces sp. NPDC001339]|uniref:hypothetical protein n=1 Tax=Streptomyces sp. NPDC001339 TaxID=3364563 RepID=UPI0036BEBA9F